MLNRFEGKDGRRLTVEALCRQKMVAGNKALAEEIFDVSKLLAIPTGTHLIEQDGADNDVYFILAGNFEISVNGRQVARRFPDDHVGEMAAVEPSQKRSATVSACEDSVVARISEGNLSDLGNRHPEIYKFLAKELSKRLLQRNSFVATKREKIRVFIISSAESLDVARTVQNAFSHDSFLPIVWTDGVFKATSYPLQSLEDAVDDSDFAVAIAHGDDVAHFKGLDWPMPRDNVIFELGLFMGRLGKQRAILMEPRNAGVKLPSDLAGVTTIPYKYEKGPDAAALMGPACNMLRDHIMRLGPNN